MREMNRTMAALVLALVESDRRSVAFLVEFEL